MPTPLASLMELVPDVFAAYKVACNQFDKPVLIVMIVKENGAVKVTTEPEFNTDGVSDKLWPELFEEGKVFELWFEEQGLTTCWVDEEPAAPDEPGLANLLSFFGGDCCAAALDLVRAMDSFPSIENLIKHLNEYAKDRLWKVLFEGNLEAFVDGPTNIKVITASEQAVLEAAPLFESPALQTILSDFEAMIGDPANLVIPIQLNRENRFYELAVTIYTVAIGALLPDIVRAQQMAIMDRIETIFVAMRQKISPHPPDDTPYRTA